MTSEAQRKASLDYYYRNREKILQRNRERYRNDKLYRETIIEQVKASLKKRSEQKKLEKDARKLRKKYWKKFKYKGEIIEFCRITLLAKQINRSQQTLRLWEKNGLLPATIKVNGIRYYSEYQYNLIIEKWNLYGEKDLYKFFNEVRKNWKIK